MKTNMGYADRLIRIAIAVVLGSLAFGGIISGPIAALGYVFAGILLLTSLVGFCPLYLPFGINTFREPQSKAPGK
jgi:hypothetical protein